MQLSLMCKRAVEDLAVLHYLMLLTLQMAQFKSPCKIYYRQDWQPFRGQFTLYIHMLDTSFSFFHLNKVIPFDASVSDVHFQLMII
jgi:hypothetical protein